MLRAQGPLCAKPTAPPQLREAEAANKVLEEKLREMANLATEALSLSWDSVRFRRLPCLSVPD